MPAKRAGYTVTTFVIDVSTSMGKMREVKVPVDGGKTSRTVQMTNLEWALQFVLLKVQELIFHNRKTDMCGVVLAGTDETSNIINDERPDEYLHVTEFIDIAHPTSETLAKIAALRPSMNTGGDPLDAVIVALNAQNNFLASKNSWTRKLILVTDGENPIATTDYKSTIEAMNQSQVITSIVGVDFDDPEINFREENKSEIKTRAEKFWRDKFVARLGEGLFATCEYALRECARPEVKEVKSAMTSNILRIGDPDEHPDQSISLTVRTSKATAIARPPPMKKFARIDPQRNGNAMDWEGSKTIQYAAVQKRTDHFIKGEDETELLEVNGDSGPKMAKNELIKAERDDDGELVRVGDGQPATNSSIDNRGMRPVSDEDIVMAYKYGSTYIPADKTDFEKLQTEKGMDILGFIPQKKFRREWAAGEVYYIWGDTESGRMQVAFSSIVQAMFLDGLYAVIRMVTGKGYAPKLGVAVPRMMEKAHCLLWVQMPFAEDLRNYTFQSLDRLYNKRGQPLEKHGNIPTDEMMEAMDAFVDSMDLMEVEKDDEGNRIPYFDTLYSYNPALHRVKQALFHAAVSPSLNTHPLPPPHPDLIRYFEQPKKVLKRSHKALEHCKKVFNIKQAPPKIAARKEVALVTDQEDAPLLIRPAPAAPKQLPPPFSDSDHLVEATVTKNVSDSEKTENGDDDRGPGTPSKRAKTSPKHIKSSPTKGDVILSSLSPGPSQDPVVKEDEDVKPEITIGLEHPLEDFKAVLRGGEDVVSGAVLLLGDVIKELVVAKQFPNRRKAELLEALKFLRVTCLKEDEIVAWNEFLRELKEVCLESEPGNRPFWDSLRALGKSMSLISKSEVTNARTAKYGVKDEAQEKFFKD